MPLRWTDKRRLRILDLDIENAPWAYWYEGRPTARVTAIAASWVGEKKVHCWLLGMLKAEEMLRAFLSLYREADIVTAHNVRRHDLPTIQANLARYDLPLLGPVLTQDTLSLKPSFKDFSRSQENLCARLKIPAPKEHMSVTDWEEANTLSDAGWTETRRRVVGDVVQHKLLREELIRRNWLRPPRTWAG